LTEYILNCEKRRANHSLNIVHQVLDVRLERSMSKIRAIYRHNKWRDITYHVVKDFLVDWCLTPTLAVFQLYRDVCGKSDRLITR
jgi:hypothetical protein